MKRSKQGGAIVGFLVASAVLALLLVGGVYAVRHYPEWVGSNTSTDTDKSSTDKRVAESDNTDNKQSGESENSTPSSQTETKDTADGTNSGSTDNAGDSSTVAPQTTPQTLPSDASPSPDASGNGNLPHTGPIDTVFSMIGAGAIVAAAVMYARSRELQ